MKFDQKSRAMVAKLSADVNNRALAHDTLIALGFSDVAYVPTHSGMLMFNVSAPDGLDVVNAVDAAKCSTVRDDDDLRLCIVVWLDNGVKLVCDFDGYMYAHLYLHFVKE